MTTAELARLPRIWHSAPRRWGHRLHSLCSYMAMFPPSLPHVFIRWLTAPGDVVYDPFSGRGTTVLEACLQGRTGLGSDANPLAWVLSSAKAHPPSRRTLETRLNELKHDCDPAQSVKGVPADIQMLFSRNVLKQLISLREAININRRTDRYLLAVLAGMLHANADSAGNPRGLTVAMPNTFAMAPGYVRRYIKKHRLVPPSVSVIDKLTERVGVFPSPPADFASGIAWQQDVTQPIEYPDGLAKPKLIFASPPYLQVIKYAKFNWIRHWLIDSNHRDVDSKLFASSSVDNYLQFMFDMLSNVSQLLRPDGYCCLVIGDVRRKTDQKSEELDLASLVAQYCLVGTSLRLVGIIKDSLPTEHKVSRIWGETRGNATKTDRILVLAGPQAKRLPTMPRIDWEAAS